MASPTARPVAIAALAVLALLLGLGLWRMAIGRGDAARESSGGGDVPPASARSGPTPDARTRGGHEASARDDGERRPTDADALHRALPAVAGDDPSLHGALEGRVIDWSTRRGVGGAELGFVQAGTTHVTLAAADGHYRFEAPGPGAWALTTVTAEGYLPYAPELGHESVMFVARPGRGIQRADLLLTPAVSYAGLVVDAGGEPVVGADVELFGADAGERALVGIPSSFRSDGEGRFEFAAPDGALLEARHPDHPPGRARVDGAAQLSHELRITLDGALPSAAAAPITGVLLDAEGVGLPDVEIHAEPIADGLPGLVRASSSVSEADGSFELGPLDDHAYAVSAQLGGLPRIERRPVEPGARVELRLTTGHTLRGRLVDEAGAPVPVGTVVLLAIEALARRPISGLSVFDPTGAFEFLGLAPGRYELRAIAQGRARSQGVAVELPTDGERISVVLGEGARLAGEVLDGETGEPLELALVTVQGVDAQASILPGLSSTVTDAEGRFELVGLEPGRTSVHAAAFAHDAKIVPGVELEPGALALLRVELWPVAEGERPKTEITGIGVAIATAEDAIVVVDVIAGGGAEAAGIIPGETIVAVDGVTVVELGFEDAIQNIRGQVGTTVELELVRLDATREILDVERRVVQTP